MGLTASATGLGALDGGLIIHRETPEDCVIALAGNPNVGKSTVFNSLTGMNQHTGNWPGKTVSNAQGRCERAGKGFVLVDLPGTYSLLSHSEEETVARDFICFGGADGAAVVCDATCLERNMNLVLQVLEITPNTVVCVNLMDEAEKKGIRVDTAALSQKLGVPVIAAAARQGGRGLSELTEALAQLPNPNGVHRTRYLRPIEEALDLLQPVLEPLLNGRISPRWAALRLLENETELLRSLGRFLGYQPEEAAEVAPVLRQAREQLFSEGYTEEKLRDNIVSCLVLDAEDLCGDCVTFDRVNYAARDRKIDRILTGRWTGAPVMVLLLLGIFWLTIVGANYPSQLLSTGLFWLGERFGDLLHWLAAPEWLCGLLADGVYRVLAWVVSVMLPPMAIFFPLFTLLEDLGYLPRVAFNLDRGFHRANACGKQALTMCMGFGCNAAGVVGCRIIDSPRERLIAMLTNNFVPCNGRFPTMIAIISIFFNAAGGTLVSALILTAVILLGVAATLVVSWLLSKTILRGQASSFALELPPYRRPQIGRVIVRSICDRTLFVLGRAAVVAAPAGALIWLLANVTAGGQTLLAVCSGALDPFARWIGLDGVLLLAFILGFPANEIVIPIAIMAYLSQGTILSLENAEMYRLFTANGWTWLTALCTLIFSLMHWPCSTTCLTIRKESGSWKWTLAAIAIPTVCGMAICFLITLAARLCGAV
ncbi:MAG: ferrous iron transport protein B [Acutalibacteraceae bacterium]